MINPYDFMRVLTDKLPEDSIVVCANGTACVTMFQSGIVKKGQRIFWNSGCASMGYALPAAIGACFASGKEVICIEGDGSIMMNLQELQTIAHYDLPIKIFILNNQGYHSIQETQDNYFNGNYTGCTEKDISFPNWESLAESFKLNYWNFKEIDIDSLLNNSYQFLCEVVLENYKFRRQNL